MPEKHFEQFRKNTIGHDQTFISPFGEKKIIYSDWTASGRLYDPIEKKMQIEIGPFVGNTHTETSVTGSIMTKAYHHALGIIKQHVHANTDDVIISSNSGMTGVINKFQRILGLKVHEKHRKCVKLKKDERPIVFVTHMEHHSNQTSWLETLAEVRIMPHDDQGLVDLAGFQKMLLEYSGRKTKIAAVTSCSNVTGIITPYHEIAQIIHQAGGLCFVDFAASAPYIDINMHPDLPGGHLDALYFSPHKFLGGPGSSGVLIFNRVLYKNEVPDNPGGGTVDWTNPWGGHKYVDDIEQREDGGTPAFLQTMRVALAIRLKEEMGVDKILAREEELLDKMWPRLNAIPNLHVLAGHIRKRLGIISFYIEDMHYNLGVRLLNDHFGIQVRGGCSCAGTYGHFLLHVDKNRSKYIAQKINKGDFSEKPGWVRLSIHPTLSDADIEHILNALEQLAQNHRQWAKDYIYNVHSNEFQFKGFPDEEKKLVEKWFEAI